MPKRTHRNPDHVQRHNTPSPNNEAIANQLEALLTPAIFAQQAKYRQLGNAAAAQAAVGSLSALNAVERQRSPWLIFFQVAVRHKTTLNQQVIARTLLRRGWSWAGHWYTQRA